MILLIPDAIIFNGQYSIFRNILKGIFWYILDSSSGIILLSYVYASSGKDNETFQNVSSGEVALLEYSSVIYMLIMAMILPDITVFLNINDPQRFVHTKYSDWMDEVK